jgi:hypothetical protein
MSGSTAVGGRPTEFVGVVRFVNHYLALHFQGNKKIFVSKHAESDIKVAQLTAKTFAEQRHLPYNGTPMTPDRPLITVWKEGSSWYPAALYADEGVLLKKFGHLDLGGSSQQAIAIAQEIAANENTDCIPSIGLSVQKGDLTRR